MDNFPGQNLPPLPTQPVCLLPWEIPSYESLEWMPLAIRYKLDKLGLKMHLKQWQAMSLDDRRALLAAAFASPQEQERFAMALRQKVAGACGETLSTLPLSPMETSKENAASPSASVSPELVPHPMQPPEEITQKLRDLGFSWAPEIGQGWSPFLRYAAVKTFTSRKPDPNLADIALSLGWVKTRNGS